MMRSKQKLLLSITTLVTSAFAFGCASNQPTQEEYADAEQRIAEIREAQRRGFYRYEYDSMPGLAIEYQVFNNSFRARPDMPLGYEDMYRTDMEIEETEDPIKRQEEELLREEEAEKVEGEHESSPGTDDRRQ
ncbi:hypothetical protein KS4_35240 [Poriferisphaera corsica]|uniref:Lipoprotein n=1 Tax=Poriferisphaera corsica TaxID=2528020 RepID=A0A517YYZ4_9BACT|nr:hypothetical protein [Poriferisphaera corsica]QDU35443.1 hypothetical protein KS4_35240 [Poriferisphaera corsica]